MLHWRTSLRRQQTKQSRQMNPTWKLAPQSKRALSTPSQLADRLRKLLGLRFHLSGRARTDGSNIRKLVASTLEDYPLPRLARKQDYEIIPPRRKGVPKLLREFADTYIVTSGRTYNLQVWNRNPLSNSVQVQYSDGETLSAKDVRFVLVRVDPDTETISAIAVLTTQYIEAQFGLFGRPTIKNQLIISATARASILSRPAPLLVGADSGQLERHVTCSYSTPACGIHDPPRTGHLFSVRLIANILFPKLVGKQVPSDAMKTRGQSLERIVASLLGYRMDNEQLAGGYPDITNQLLEVKAQESPTVDLGRYSPQFEETVASLQGFTTGDVRYNHPRLRIQT